MPRIQKLLVPTPKSFPASARYQTCGCSTRAPGIDREPIAMSYPSRSIFASNLSTSSIGVLWSALVNSTYSPCASSMPAFTAPPLPRFGFRSISRSMGNVLDSSRATGAVSSLLPSLTTTISNGFPFACRNSTIPGMKRFSRSCSLYAGMTTDRYGRASIVGSVGLAQSSHFTQFRQRLGGVILVQLLAANPFDVIAHAVARGLGGFPAESLQLRNIRDAVTRVAHAVLAADVRLDVHAQRFRNDAGKFNNRVPATAADIEDLIVRLVAFQGQSIGAGHVVHIDVIPKLLAVFKHRRPLSLHHLQREDT